jgi:hypothetical protein
MVPFGRPAFYRSEKCAVTTLLSYAVWLYFGFTLAFRFFVDPLT